MSETELERPSTPALIGDAIKQATALFSTEVSLVRLEATEKLTLALTAVVSLVAAAVFIIVALIFLLAGLVWLLVALLHWAVFVSCFAVGGGIAVIAILTILLAVRNLSAARLRPARTMREVQSTKDLAKGVVS